MKSGATIVIAGASWVALTVAWAAGTRVHAAAQSASATSRTGMASPPGAKLTNPVASSPESIAAGKAAYDLGCAPCHGNAGQGAVRAGISLSVIEAGGKQPSDLTDAQWDHGSTDGDIFTNIKRGLPPAIMAGFDGQFSDVEIWSMVNYLRTLATKGASQQPRTPRPSGPVQQRIAPGLATLTDDVLYGDVWRRPELSPRDRSLVTVSVLIATGKPAQLIGHLGRAFDNGLLPSEASGVLAHLAIYCGWPSAVTALEVYDQVYTARKVDTTALRAVGPRLPPLTGDAARARAASEELAGVAPKFVQLTNDVVFDDLWRRSDLSVRDRSLVTIAALAAMGDDDQLDFYLRRGLESGLTRPQITEALTHLGFYAGWSKATRAMTVAAKTFGR